MDIRNIREVPPVVENEAYLEAIYNLEAELLQGYSGKIEKDLPLPPIDINTFKGQQILKDFSARVIEETAEGYESTSAVIDMYQDHGFNNQTFSDSEWQMVANNLQNSNEEQADAMAFYMALLMYANLEIKDIYDYANTKLKDLVARIDIGKVENMLDLMLLGSYAFDLEESEDKEFGDMGCLYDLLSEANIEDMGLEVDHVNSYIPAFRFSNKDFHRYEDHMLWRVAYHINISRNFLKNKPWKQSQELTDITRYSEQLALGLIRYLGYLYTMGFTPDTLYTLCFKKNRVNHFRQNSGY
nr:MAG TPA: dUTPase [Caudoviricetes sp.]